MHWHPMPFSGIQCHYQHVAVVEEGVNLKLRPLLVNLLGRACASMADSHLPQLTNGAALNLWSDSE